MTYYRYPKKLIVEEVQEKFERQRSEQARLESRQAKQGPNILLIAWIILSFICALWVASGNPDMNFFACIFWGGVIGFMAVAGLISAYGQIWIGWHTPEIIDEVCDGLLGNGRRGRK